MTNFSRRYGLLEARHQGVPERHQGKGEAEDRWREGHQGGGPPDTGAPQAGEGPGEGGAGRGRGRIRHKMLRRGDILRGEVREDVRGGDREGIGGGDEGGEGGGPEEGVPEGVGREVPEHVQAAGSAPERVLPEQPDEGGAGGAVRRRVRAEDVAGQLHVQEAGDGERVEGREDGGEHCR